MSKISVIIVTWNSGQTIKGVLDSLSRQEPELIEILIVDNNSQDQTRDIIKQYNNVRLIVSKENLGFGKACNLAAKSSKGDYILFLNPDTVVKKNVVKNLVEYLDNEESVAVVAPKLLNESGSIQREVSNFPTLISEIIVLLKLHRFFGLRNFVYPNFDYGKIQEAEHVMGAVLLIRKSVFDQVGGFDERFFLWFEETDLLKRITDLGFKIMYYPEVEVVHLGGISTRQVNFIQKQTIWNKSLLLYFGKHKSWFEKASLTPFILLSYPLAVFRNLFKGVKV